MADLTPEEQAELKMSAEANLQGSGDGLPPIPQVPQEPEPPQSSAGENLEKSKDWQSLEAQKKHFQEKSQKLEEELKKYKGSPTPTSSQTPDKPLNPSMETVKVARLLAGYNDEESEFILKNSGSSSYEDIKATVGNDWIKDAIQARREKVAKEQMTPAPSGTSGGSSFGIEFKDGMSEKELRLAQKKKLEQLQRQGRAEV